MLFRFECGKSYVWIFWLCLAVFASGFIGEDGFTRHSPAAWALPVTMLYVAICALCSGVNLDSTWSAVVRKSQSPGLFYVLLVAEVSAAVIAIFLLIRH